MPKTLRTKVLAYAQKQYDTLPDKPWAKYPDNEVLRHCDTRKWYGLIFPVEREKLGVTGAGVVDILNVKCDPVMSVSVRGQKGILPAYHMNHTEWLSILLDGSVPLKTIYNLLDISYTLTMSKKKREKMRPPKEWLIPANPKYYDVEHAFDDTDIIEWKQSGGIKKGDTIFLYVAAPVSAILFKCKVLEADIPYEYHSENLHIRKLIRVELERRYEPGVFTFDRLRDEYGVNAIRGPRGIPNSLSHALKK